MAPDDTSFDSLIRAVARAPSCSPAERVGAKVQVGDVVGGNFRLEAELGRGGMGVVYRATDLTLDRQVALKIMLAERWHEEARPRLLEIFDREARATAKLSHPAIVHLYQSGDDHGLLYLVLELLRGESLQARLERSLPSEREAVEIAEQILLGLAHAHAQGILHRDLKPQNVFMCEDGRVRLLDFGLAALQDRAPDRASDRAGDRAADRAVQILSKGGTPSYMAPEQWSGAPQDERTDLWAVGMILVRMLSTASLAPPSSVDTLRDELVVEGVSAGLAKVIRRATAFELRDRYPSAQAMLAALAEVAGLALGSRPGVSPPRPVVAGPGRWRRRPRAALAALAALAIVVVGGAAAWWWLRAGPAPVPLAELAGNYRGQFDQLALKVNPDGTVWGAYHHDQGFLQGTLVGDKLAGWWCETPSRLPPGDAGEFEMRVTRGESGAVVLDGRYRYGRQGQWDENWNLAGTSEPMADLHARLAPASPPCAPPP